MTLRPTDDPEVLDNTEAQRYEIRTGPELIGFALYHRNQERITFTHVEIDPAFEGRGLGGRLVRAALDDAKTRELTVVPLCPFVAGWIRRHPDYMDMVDQHHRATVDPAN